MHHIMRFKIHNFKLALLAILFVSFLTALGFWQLSRAQQKVTLLQAFNERKNVTPLTSNSINQQGDWRFYRTALIGRFDNQHTFLLDNKIFHSEVGYEVYTLFIAYGIKQPILIDRGFIPKGEERKILPQIKTILGNVTIIGMLNLPPAYFALGEMLDTVDQDRGITRVEYINLAELDKYLNMSLFPYIVTLAPDQPYAYKTEWQIVTMPPEKHRGYAVQWFALALTLLILFFVLNHRAGQTT